MDKLKAMQTVVTIADQGSLTATAVVLGASLPAVVRTLAALELHLGLRLFNRTTRRISLTEEGRFYIDHCRQLLANIKEIEAVLTADSIEPSGLITITAPVMYGQMFVAPAITRFVKQYPKVRANLVLLDRVVNLLEENIDLGIRIGHLEDSTLIAQPLATVRRMVVASPNYLAQHGIPQHPKELLNANCIIFSGSSGPWWTFYEGGKQFNVAVCGNLEYNHVAPAAQACMAGMGFGTFISYQVAEAIEQKQLQVVLEAFEPPARPIHLIYPHARLLPARTKALIEWMKKELKTSARIAAKID